MPFSSTAIKRDTLAMLNIARLLYRKNLQPLKGFDYIALYAK